MPESLRAHRSLQPPRFIFFLLKYLFYVSMWLPACPSVCVSASPFGGQMRASNSLELGLQAILGYLMPVLGTKPRTSARVPAPPQQPCFCPRSHQASEGQLDSTSARHSGGKNGGSAHTPIIIMGFWKFPSLSSAVLHCRKPLRPGYQLRPWSPQIAAF